MKKIDSFSSLDQVEKKKLSQEKYIKDLPPNFIAKDIEKAETSIETDSKTSAST